MVEISKYDTMSGEYVDTCDEGLQCHMVTVGEFLDLFFQSDPNDSGTLLKEVHGDW